MGEQIFVIKLQSEDSTPITSENVGTILMMHMDYHIGERIEVVEVLEEPKKVKSCETEGCNTCYYEDNCIMHEEGAEKCSILWREKA